MRRQEREPIPAATEDVGSAIVEAAFRVHRAMGPGLLESIYEDCLCLELGKMGVGFERQLDVPLVYEGVELDSKFRLDLLGEGCVVVEVKAVEKLLPIHTAQALSYLRLTGTRLGFLINFTDPLLKDGIHRVVI